MKQFTDTKPLHLIFQIRKWAKKQQKNKGGRTKSM